MNLRVGRQRQKKCPLQRRTGGFTAIGGNDHAVDCGGSLRGVVRAGAGAGANGRPGGSGIRHAIDLCKARTGRQNAAFVTDNRNVLRGVRAVRKFLRGRAPLWFCRRMGCGILGCGNECPHVRGERPQIVGRQIVV